MCYFPSVGTLLVLLSVKGGSKGRSTNSEGSICIMGTNYINIDYLEYVRVAVTVT